MQDFLREHSIPLWLFLVICSVIVSMQHSQIWEHMEEKELQAIHT
jgi:hypothetical protein